VAKTSLRQFQTDLAQRLSSAKAQPAVATRLGVQCGTGFWLIDLADAGEIVPVPEVLPVPLTKPWYVGVTNIRGSLYSVVDFSSFTGAEGVTRGQENRLVLVGARFGINTALLVTRMLGLRNPREFNPHEDPGAGGASAATPWMGAYLRDGDGRLWHELKLQQLVEHQDFLQVGL
jgi:twitching motility protein PilI